MSRFVTLSEAKGLISITSVTHLRCLDLLLMNWPPFGQFIFTHQPSGRSRG